MHSGAAREFAFEERDFRRIAHFVRAQAGIVLGERKRDLVYSRLSRRVRALGLADFAAYCAHLESPAGEAERGLMLNALTTNFTAFFREPHHFEFLAREALGQLAQSPPARDRLRIWSAGCSSGEEAYSIAMVVRHALAAEPRRDARILATDIDTQMVAAAAAGRYAAEAGAAVPEAMKRAYVREAADGSILMSEALKSLLTFRPLNLFDRWPMKGPFDAIFCRNVVIYFHAGAKRALFDRFAEMLKPGGFLFIGHSENLFQISNRFQHVGRTIYRRVS